MEEQKNQTTNLLSLANRYVQVQLILKYLDMQSIMSRTVAWLMTVHRINPTLTVLGKDEDKTPEWARCRKLGHINVAQVNHWGKPDTSRMAYSVHVCGHIQ